MIGSAELDLEDYFLTKQDFSKQVEKLVRHGQGDIEFMEAVTAVADVHEIDISDIEKYLTPVIKRKIELEAQDRNLIKFDKNAPSLSIFFSNTP